MTRRARKTLLLVLILAVAFAARLAAGFWWESRLPEGQDFFFGDSHTYWVLAQRIVRGEPYYYGTPDTSVFRTPGYPVVLAGLFLVVGDEPPVMWARALSAVLGMLAVGGVYWLTKRLFSTSAGLLAAAIAAVYPGAVSLGAMVLSEALFCPLMLLQLILWTASWKAPTRSRTLTLAALAGIAAGLATLARPSWLLFTPFAAGLAILLRRDRIRHIAPTAAMIVGLCLTMMPWWIRNYGVTGHFVATTLQTGASLYDGLNHKADGSSNMWFVPVYHAAEKESELVETPSDTFEYRLDRRLGRAALHWATSHPRQAVQLAGVKLWRMWNVWPNESEFRSWPLRLVIALTYGPLLCGAIFGAWSFRDRGWPYILPWLPAVYLSLIHMIFVGSLRYREPLMLPMIALAAGWLHERLFARSPAENQLPEQGSSTAGERIRQP